MDVRNTCQYESTNSNLTSLISLGVLTGKSPLFGGIQLRPEATGYGAVYMAKHAIEDKLKSTLEGSHCAVSGSGNVAQYASRSK